MSEETKQEAAPEQQTSNQKTSGSSLKLGNIQVELKALIDWLSDSGEVEKTETCWRGAVPMFIYFGEKLKKDESVAKKKVRAYLKAVNEEKTVFVLAEGTVMEVLAKLEKRILLAPNVMAQLQMVVSQLAEFSDLKGIMISAVFGVDTPIAAGFGFLSESADVTDADIQVLATAAEGQVDLFKEELRKKRNIQFEGDSKIVLPNAGDIRRLGK